MTDLLIDFNENLALELGEGHLGWHKGERESGRYGSVSLFKSLDTRNLERVVFPRYTGIYTLATITLEEAPSQFMSKKMIGKRFLKQRPGLKTKLGEGEVHYPDPRCVGVKPLIEIETLLALPQEWLNYEALVSLHNQKVKLYLIPMLWSQ